MRPPPLVLNFVLPVAVAIAWETTGRAGILPSYLSYPSAIARAIWSVTIDGELAVDAGVSLYRVLAGFLIGAAAGLVVGLAAGLTPIVRSFFDPLVSFLFAVPKIAFLPVFLLLFGIGHASKIAIIGFSCFFPMFLTARQAVLSVNKHYLWAARNMGAGSRTILRRVLLPAAAPQLFAGLRVGLAHAFVVLFAAEVIGSHAGLGQLVSEGEDSDRFDLMLGAILVFAALGFLGDRLLMALRRRVLRGQTMGTEEQVRP